MRIRSIWMAFALIAFVLMIAAPSLGLAQGQAPATPEGKAKADTTAKAGEYKYVGVAACAMCHKGPSKGNIYEVWQGTAHAKAFEKLGADNQKNATCLGCHTTGYGKAMAAGVTPEMWSMDRLLDAALTPEAA